MLGSFGKVVFEVTDKKLFTPEGFSRSSGANYGEHSLLQGKARKQFIGPELKSISFDILLNASLGVKPRETIDELISMCEKGVTEYLIIGGKLVTELPLVITRVSDEWQTVYSGGELESAKVSISLEEYR